jgi:hypothetical protein
MAEGLAKATDATRTWTVDGVDYRVRKFRLRDWGEIEAWLADHVPDPWTIARRHMEGLPPDVAKHIWDRACADGEANWPPSFDDPRARRLLLSPEGQTYYIFLALRRTVAGMTVERAREVADRLDDGDFERLMELTRPGDPEAPKAATPTGGAATNGATSSVG